MIDSGYQNATHTQVRVYRLFANDQIYFSLILKILNLKSMFLLNNLYLQLQIQFRRVLETCDPHDVTLSVSFGLIIYIFF